ncbi:MAG: HlyD family secretion protein [Neisseriaceae bacterium]|nr:HlyD family secretion protein [Neisseriaceae bacterium]MBP6862796.1 HlyD family secretion protein [Neisseriaceae bacterium]
MSETVYKRSRIAILAALACAVVGYGLYALIFATGTRQSTNNAYVKADFTHIAPKVAGFMSHVLVEDNQVVKAGELIAQIDDHDFQVALQAATANLTVAQAQEAQSTAQLTEQKAIIQQANAAVQVAQAEQTFAKQERQRYQQLASEGAGSMQDAQQAQARIQVSQANLLKAQAVLAAAQNQVAVLNAKVEAAQGARQQAEAQLARAKLDLSYTQIISPIDGVIGHRTARIGNYVSAGTQLMAIVPTDGLYVVANFQETQLAKVQAKQRVTIKVDTFQQDLYGEVDSIAPATGVTFAAIAPENATGNFTKITQRIPVKIRLNPDQPLLSQLRAGMSVEAQIDTSTRKEAK